MHETRSGLFVRFAAADGLCSRSARVLRQGTRRGAALRCGPYRQPARKEEPADMIWGFFCFPVSGNGCSRTAGTGAG